MADDLIFDRTVSEELLGFLDSGAGRNLIERRNADPQELDVQLRRDQRGSKDWATLYCGLTKVLDVIQNKGQFRLDAHPTHKKQGFQEQWSEWQSRESIEREWAAVERYLRAAVDSVGRNHKKEGLVHAGLCSGTSDAYRIINREVSPSFKDTPTRQRIKDELWAPLGEALERNDNGSKWWPKKASFGTSPDMLAVDVGGRMTIIEAKHASALGMITKVSLQAGFYAGLYARLLQSSHAAVDAMERMLEQRVALGLARKGVLHLLEPIRVVPVVAIGGGDPTRTARDRLWEVATAVSRSTQALGTEPVEVWYLDELGRINELERPGDVVSSRG